jgi:hypothetical protein
MGGIEILTYIIFYLEAKEHVNVLGEIKLNNTAGPKVR